MSSKAPKTGLAGSMRSWMSKQTRPFTVAMICDGLAVQPGKDHQIIHNALRDFLARGEVLRCPRDKRNRRQVAWRHRYNPIWRKATKGGLQARILKAMYVSGTWAISDIRRLAESEGRSWIEKMTRRLVKSGHVQAVGRRPCAHGAGAEILYHVTDRDKFRVEVMQ